MGNRIVGRAKINSFKHAISFIWNWLFIYHTVPCEPEPASFKFWYRLCTVNVVSPTVTEYNEWSKLIFNLQVDQYSKWLWYSFVCYRQCEWMLVVSLVITKQFTSATMATNIIKIKQIFFFSMPLDHLILFLLNFRKLIEVFYTVLTNPG